MSRPSDHIDAPELAPNGDNVTQPSLGVVGYLRFFWRQLTSMRTALLLLLLLALAAVPGSLVPQRSSDPNGVIKYFTDNPDLAPILDALQLFDVFTSIWFSSIYLLLFLSLIGCVLPRTAHHLRALRTPPPKTPARLERLPAFRSVETTDTDAAAAIESARTLLRKSGYRVRVFDGPNLSVSAERGYLRETGNLVFHTALIGVLLAVGIGGGFTYTGQRVIVEGQPFVNVLSDYSSFTPGRFFEENMLPPFQMVLEEFSVEYEQENVNALGFPIDYTADVSVSIPGEPVSRGTVKVNQPLPLPSFGSVTSIETGAEIGASVADVGTTGPATTSDSGIRGAVTCLIGVLCTFLVFTLLRSFTLGARRLSLLTSRPVHASLMVQPREPESSFTPSLVELSISRT